MSPFWILLQLRVTEVVVTTGAIDVQSSSHIVATNKQRPNFLEVGVPFVSSNQQCQSTEGMSQSIEKKTV